MKLNDYQNPETGEIKEFDVEGSETIPWSIEEDGVIWKRYWGTKAAIHIPEHMKAGDHNRFRASFKGPSSSPTGRKTFY